MANEMDAVVCACGRRIERHIRGPYSAPTFEDLLTAGHDPDECSRQIGFEGRFTGRREMAEAALEHLAARRSLGSAELAEISTRFREMVSTLPLKAVSS